MINKKVAKKTKLLGWLFIICLWSFSGIFVLVGGSLLLMHIDGQYLTSSQITEEVTVVKLRGNSYPINSEIPDSTMYVIKFPSGENKEVNFLGGLAFEPGTKLNLKYKKTKLFKEVIVDNYEIAH